MALANKNPATLNLTITARAVSATSHFL